MNTTLAALSSVLVPIGAVAAQASWQALSPAASPPPAAHHVMAYDEARDRVVLVDGSVTWTFDGTTWTQASPPATPPRVDAMAWEPAAGAVLAFGNDLVNGPRTWRWDGVGWMRLAVATTPTTRGTVRMVEEPSRGAVLLVIGSQSSVETWEWSESAWLRRMPATSPPPRSRFVLAHDAARAETVLFGGDDPAQPGFLDDTWLWDGRTWRAATPASRPPGRIDSSLTHDALRGRCVLVAGDLLGPLPSDDVWEWDGADWTMRPPAPFPLRYAHDATYDTSRQRLVLFGGDGGAPVVLADTWVYRTPVAAAAEHYGSACAGTAGTPNLTSVAGARPWIGDTLALQLGGLPFGTRPLVLVGGSRTRWGGLVLPFDLTPVGMTGCALLASGESALAPRATAGTAVFGLAIPAVGVFPGQQAFLQGFVLDAGANPFGATASNGLALTLGAR